jgi:hypothetical protein
VPGRAGGQGDRVRPDCTRGRLSRHTQDMGCRHSARPSHPVPGSSTLPLVGTHKARLTHPFHVSGVLGVLSARWSFGPGTRHTSRPWPGGPMLPWGSGCHARHPGQRRIPLSAAQGKSMNLGSAGRPTASTRVVGMMPSKRCFGTCRKRSSACGLLRHLRQRCGGRGFKGTCRPRCRSSSIKTCPNVPSPSEATTTSRSGAGRAPSSRADLHAEPARRAAGTPAPGSAVPQGIGAAAPPQVLVGGLIASAWLGAITLGPAARCAWPPALALCRDR